jgi:hypothetical protein
MKPTPAFFLAALAILTIAASPIKAAVLIEAQEVVNFYQVRNGEEARHDVLFSISGALDTTDLTFGALTGGVPGVSPWLGGISTGGMWDEYEGVAGPTSFGTGLNNFNAVAVGSPFTISGYLGRVSLPRGYISGSPLSAELTVMNTSFNELGVDVKSSPYHWSVPNGDMITLSFIPEPSAAVLLFLGLGSALLLRRSPLQSTR